MAEEAGLLRFVQAGTLPRLDNVNDPTALLPDLNRPSDGICPDQRFRAKASLAITTGACDGVSGGSNSQPRWMRVPIVEKNLGATH